MKLTSLALLSTCAFIALSSCKQAKKPASDDNQPAQSTQPTQPSSGIHGEWRGEREYVNQHFNFSITVPESWGIQKGQPTYSKEVIETISSGGDKKLLQQSLEQYFQPLIAGPKIGTSQPSSNVVITLENISASPHLTDAKSYLITAKAPLQKALGEKLQFVGDITLEKLGQIEFAVQHSILTIEGNKLQLKSCVLIANKHVMTLTITTLPNEEKEILAPMLDSIKNLK